MIRHVCAVDNRHFHFMNLVRCHNCAGEIREKFLLIEQNREKAIVAPQSLLFSVRPLFSARLTLESGESSRDGRCGSSQPIRMSLIQHKLTAAFDC